MAVSHISPCLTHVRNIRYLLYELEKILCQRAESKNTKKKKETILV